MARALRALISASALRHNLQVIQARAPQQRVIAMIKANAYGHGLVQVAQILDQADAFGVACIEEALSLRRAGIQQPIVLMEGFFEGSELAEIAAWDLECVVHNSWQLEALGAYRGKPLAVWFKLDTGMHRLGFSPDVWPAVYAQAAALPGIQIRGFMSHFAKADELQDPMTQQQTQLFHRLVQGLAGDICLANSAGILAWPCPRTQWIRPGLALYGGTPLQGIGTQEGLRPAMTLESRLIAIHQLAAGESVGYGGHFVCPEAMPVGVIAVGYGDGYPHWARSEVTPVWLGGQRVPVIGRVSMDMCHIDLRGVAQAQVGQRVELWGANLPVEEVARSMGTIPHVLLAGLNKRVPLEVVSD